MWYLVFCLSPVGGCCAVCLSVSFRHFTSNPHRLTLRLKGSTELAGQLEAQEKRALKEAEIEIGLEGLSGRAHTKKPPMP